MTTDSLRLQDLSPLQRAVFALKQVRSELDSVRQAHSEPIAIVGIGCRFPGGADSPDTFWQLLRDGADAVIDVPSDRWDMEAYYDPDPEAGRIYTRRGAFIDHVDQFDAAFFGISPREAVMMDPQQRLLLEVTWEALEHAGQSPEALVGSQTGVFVGISASDYARLGVGDPEQMDVYSSTGTAFSVASGRLSYLLGVNGPSLPVDTACSSSLVALHLACQSLRQGESDLALAAGVNVILAPEGTLYFCKLRALAPDGRCKAFDAAADGYVRGEGCGVIVLKRLSDALRDGDRILALVRGSAVNQDGRSNGLTAPNGPAQEAVIRKALAQAHVAPHQIGYVEAHGTGTPLGDPIELRALGSVLGQERSADRPLVVGSVKTNLGHLEAAAGVAGLIKTVLMLQHGQIPPHLHFSQPSPYIEWDKLPVEIPTQLRAWPVDEGQRRMAGVSAFGLSGTNAHIILEEAPADGDADRARPDPDLGSGVHARLDPDVGDGVLVRPDADAAPFVLPLSAHSPAALRALAEAYANLLARTDAPSLHDVCYTASRRRSHHDYRLAIVGASPAELVAQLAAESAPPPAQVFAGQRPRVAFVFPGQGGQWPGMAHDLLDHEPVFLDALQQCQAALQPHVSWDLLEVLRSAEPLEAIDELQPVLFSLQVALAALWRSWGIVPDAVVGHSLGEVAAAHVAGGLSLEDAARVICRRSQLLSRLQGQGGMAVVELEVSEAEQLIANAYPNELAIAAVNGPRATVLAGDLAALDTVLAQLTAQGVFARRIQVDVAAHSPQVEPLLPELQRELAGINPRPLSIPFYSTVHQRQLDLTGNGPGSATVVIRRSGAAELQGGELDASYWAANLRQRVEFSHAVQQLLSDGHTTFLELSPHPTLLPALAELVPPGGGLVLPSLRRDQPGLRVLRESLVALYANGQPIAWDALYPSGTCVQLPTYPWQRERFWLDFTTSAPTRRPRP
ncbi:MAG TPA: type I polyketide synthase, partial [Chloroflexota bacterium]